MEIVEIEKINRAQWETLIKESPTATWFQTEEAYRFFDSLSFMEAFAFGIENEGGLKGVAIGYIEKDGGRMKQFFSRRAIILGGPVLSEDITDEELKGLLCSLKNKLKQKAIYIEMRNFNDYSRWRKVFEDCGFGYQPHYDVIIDTTSMDVVKGNLDRNRKRNIKKAMDNGAVVDENPNADDLRQFYAMLQNLYATKVKTPLFPFEFVEKLSNIPSCSIFLAKNTDGLVLGGLVCVVLQGRAVYAWMACGDDYNFKALSPSVMANYSGICYAAEHGFTRFDFMGAGKPDDGGYGVRDFKLKFGGELVEYGRFQCVCKPLMFGIGKTGVKLMKRF